METFEHFILEGSNDDFGLTLRFSMARSNLLCGLLYGLVEELIKLTNTVTQVSTRIFFGLEVQIIL